MGKRPASKPIAPCVFKKGFVTERVDPVVDEMWRETFKVRAPFGDLRNMFRRHHCRTLNPYGDSENCPYSEQQCATAFLDAIRVVTVARPRVPVGYFIRVAKSSAAFRADQAVGQRADAATMRRTSVLPRTSEAHEADRHQAAASSASGPDEGGVGGSGGASTPAGHEGRGRGAGMEEVDVPAVPRRSDGPVPLGELLGRMAIRPRTGSEPADERPESS